MEVHLVDFVAVKRTEERFFGHSVLQHYNDCEGTPSVRSHICCSLTAEYLSNHLGFEVSRQSNNTAGRRILTLPLAS
jgi:hypothetical protein